MKKTYKISAILTIILLLMTLNKTYVAASSGSMIGPIDVSGMTKKQMTKEVREVVNVWQQKEIAIQAGAQEVSVSGEAFNFDINRSVNRLTNKQKKPWYKFWTPKPEVKSQLIVHETEQLKNTIEPLVGDNLDEAMADLLEQAADLPVRPLKLTEVDFDISEGKLLASSVLPITSENVAELIVIADKLNESIVQPKTEYSFLKEAGNKTGAKAASLAATALYNNALQSGFEVLQRHQAQQVQSYIDAGYEAYVDSKKSQDLVFSSTRQGPVKMQAFVEDNQFSVDFYVAPTEILPEIKVYTADEETIAPRVIYRYTDELSMGESEEVRSGSEGLTVDVYRQVTTVENGAEKNLVSTNYYAPIHQVILKSMEEEQVDESTLEAEDYAEDSEDYTSDTEDYAKDSEDYTSDTEDYIKDSEDYISDTEVTAVDGVTEDTIPLDDRNKLVIKKIEHPTEEQLSDENVIYSEANDSYYLIYTVDGTEEGDK